MFNVDNVCLLMLILYDNFAVRIKCEITDPLFEWNAIQLKTMGPTMAILKQF